MTGSEFQEISRQLTSFGARLTLLEAKVADILYVLSEPILKVDYSNLEDELRDRE